VAHPAEDLALQCDGADGAALLSLGADGRVLRRQTSLTGRSLRVPAADHVRAVVIGTSDPLDARCVLTPSRAATELRGCAATGGGAPAPAWLLLLLLPYVWGCSPRSSSDEPPASSA
jgi:hypothetical protein